MNMLNGTIFSSLYKKENMYKNNRTWLTYYNKYMSICLNMFEWKNLPITCNEEFLEKTLYYKGHGCIIHHDTLGYLTLNCTIKRVDFYNMPTEFNCYGSNGEINENRIKDDCIWIKNNRLKFPTDLIVQEYVERLYEIQTTIDVNMNAQKTPILVLCANEKDKLAMQNIYAQYKGNAPVIFADKNFLQDRNSVTVLKTDAPFYIKELYDYKMSVECELLTILGVNNIGNPDKKERLIVDEQQSNQDVLRNIGSAMLQTRQEACEQFNNVFNPTEELTVDYRIAPTFAKEQDHFNSIETNKIEQNTNNNIDNKNWRYLT